MRIQDALTTDRLQALSGVKLWAYPPFEGASISISLNTTRHSFGYLLDDIAVTEQAFCENWQDPLGVVRPELRRSYYKQHKTFAEASTTRGFLYFNGLAARFLRLKRDAQASAKIHLELGTTSFWSYAASNFSAHSSLHTAEPHTLDQIDLRHSPLANLCGVHCLLHNDTTAFMVRRGRTALFPQYISSSANGGISKVDEAGDYDLLASIGAEITAEIGIDCDVSRLRWLGAGISDCFHQPALYCSLYTDTPTQSLVRAFRNARDTFEVNRRARGRLSEPELVQLNLRSTARFVQISTGPWSFSVPIALAVQNLASRVRKLLASGDVHPHAKMVLLLFCGQIMGRAAQGKLMENLLK